MAAIAIEVVLVLLLAMVGARGLCDTMLPKYLGWFYIGYGLSFVFKFKQDVAGDGHSRASLFFSFLGKESLALYALHWWLGFNFLPIPQCSTIPHVAYAFIIFVVWLMLSLILDFTISKTPLAPYLLGKHNISFQKRNH